VTVHLPLSTPAVIGFVGLGRMGVPMTTRLAAAGYNVQGFDVSEAARAALSAVPGAHAVEDLGGVAAGADAVVLMLPDSAVIRQVTGEQGLLAAMRPGMMLVDMSSSEPAATRQLAVQAADSGITMIDAPVSGGVPGAVRGTLTIMAGGPADAVAAARPMLEVLGSRVLHMGPAGAGHAVKALNNLLSGIHLLATSEAMLAGQEFGLDPAVLLDVLNTSSGRSGSTENKWPNYVLTGSFDSGFGLRLLVKDMRIALGLARETGSAPRLAELATAMWAEAGQALPPDADHTEIVKWIQSGESM
jgi:3-hydroxyisobutyrate dehydrogenase